MIVYRREGASGEVELEAREERRQLIKKGSRGLPWWSSG